MSWRGVGESKGVTMIGGLWFAICDFAVIVLVVVSVRMFFLSCLLRTCKAGAGGGCLPACVGCCY
jgi:hypothetical protein